MLAKIVTEDYVMLQKRATNANMKGRKSSRQKTLKNNKGPYQSTNDRQTKGEAEECLLTAAGQG